MATSPKMPPVPRRRYPDDHARLYLVRKRRFPWIYVALGVVAAMVIAILLYLPHMPQVTPSAAGAEVPSQPTNQQVQLSGITLTPAPVGGALYLDGTIHNAGQTAINGVEVRATFAGTTGRSLGTQSRALKGVSASGTEILDFTQSPIQPNQSRPFRAYFNHYPTGWNHQIPQLAVVEVTATTPKK